MSQTPLESPGLLKASKSMTEYAEHLEPLFPHMEWDIKRSGYTIESVEYLSIVLYLTAVTFIMCVVTLVIPMAILKGTEASYFGILVTVVLSALIAAYLIMTPTAKMGARGRLIDKDLEYMLKDMQIQLSAGVPLFDTLVNIVRGGYGECSKICEDIITEVQQGKSMEDVLDNAGMWSPSEYFRRMLWQIVNALKSGGDIGEALAAISIDIRVEKENKIKSYGKELNLFGLVYLMCAIIMPSMGVTLLVILSSFMGGDMINTNLFIMIVIGTAVFQAMFIFFVKSKRPDI